MDFDKTYKVSFVTTQGVAKKYGNNRQKYSEKAVEAMKAYLKEHPVFSPDTLESFRLV